MKKVNHEELRRIIKRSYEVKEPLYIWGSVGIGKSDSVKRVARELADSKGLKYTRDVNEIDEAGRFFLVDVRVSQLDPSDLRGLPDIKGEQTRWKPPAWLPRSGEAKGILFFDELNLAAPSIQKASYQLILERRLGEYQLPPRVHIVSAGNRLSDRANVYEMSSALKNRFLHITLNPPEIDRWINWAMDHNIDQRIISFLKTNSSRLFMFNPKQKEKAFPTPRTWEKASYMIKGVEDEDLLELYLSSAVGEGVAKEMMAFIKKQEEINIKRILRNPEMAELPPEDRLDLRMVLVNGVVERYRANKDKETLRNILKLSDKLRVEFGALMLRLAKKVDEGFFKNTIRDLPEWERISNKYKKVFL